jgi:predicted DsbA family dithiol-disulfide isomerase
MNIDIVSDVICPWCYVGQRRLARALAMRPDLNVEISWRPFQLAPELPREGMERRTYLKAKFGEGAGRGPVLDALRQAGLEEGITFNFEAIERTPNTLDAHRLIYWAGGLGAQTRIVSLLFAAYFEQGRDIGQISELAAIAETGGMDAARVTHLLASDADIDRIQHDIELAGRLGIAGVPTFVLDRRFMAQGAQDPEQLVQVLDYAAAA